jgi:hypothetical protein
MIRHLPPLALVLLAAACGEQRATPAPGAQPTIAGSGAQIGPSATATMGVATPGASAEADAGPAAYSGPYVGATVMTAPVFSEMEWPPSDTRRAKENPDNHSVRLGYIRQGEKTPVILPAKEKSNCKDGWYQLVAGGYVCGKYVTTDLNHPRFKSAHAPDLTTMLPYSYGINTTQGTPLYRQVPSREERKLYEPWLSKPKAKANSDADNPYASSGDDGGSSEAPTPAPEDPSKPWYLREADAGTPVQVTLDELKEDGGPVARRMVKGFYLSLDHPFSSNGTSWWKTVDGLVAPGSQVYVAKPRSDFRGLWFDQPPPPTAELEANDAGIIPTTKAWHLPIGFITSRNGHKHMLSASHKRANSGGALRRYAILQLTGQTATIDGVDYYETDDGWWMRASDGTITEPGAPPDGLGPTEKWIDVNLKRQTMVAFQGPNAVFATIISSGRSGHETPPGSFRIREKHISSTMDGDAETASDGPYSIQDVPYIEYFSAGYAIHGAFWHDSFGNVKSHGCVNAAPWDARALFSWTEPQLPDGWHGVMATKDKPGTRVILHE